MFWRKRFANQEKFEAFDNATEDKRPSLERENSEEHLKTISNTFPGV